MNLEEAISHAWTYSEEGQRDISMLHQPGVGYPSEKYKMMTFTVHGTREDAEKALARKLLEIGDGNLIEPVKMTFGEYLEYWLSEYVSSLRSKTQRWYTQIVRNHVIPALGRIQLDKLNPLHLQRYLRQIQRLDSNGEPTGGELSPNTIHNHYRTLHAALGQAVKCRILDPDPLR
ncbi:MAG TPA: hypothetical protein GXX51_04000 [Firmicutes bacterium]|nr:hypothetical protein [Bacillota bacterium]